MSDEYSAEIHMRVSAYERERLEAAAAIQGLDVDEFMRNAVLQFTYDIVSKLDKQTILELFRKSAEQDILIRIQDQKYK